MHTKTLSACILTDAALELLLIKSKYVAEDSAIDAKT